MSMFTGIIEDISTINNIAGNTFTFAHNFSDPITLGESIAVNGMCVTVTNFSNTEFTADIIKESRDRTIFSNVKVNDTVNLERSAQIGQRNSGHNVSGHIDETGTIAKLEEEDDFYLLRITFSPENFPLVIFKGSIAIDGISLTVSNVSKDPDNPWLEVSIIPHTWDNTNLKTKKTEDQVNLEFDQVGKYQQKQSLKNYETPILKTKRLVLRPYTLEDAKQIFEITSKYPKMTQHMSWDTPQSIEETIEHYHKSLHTRDEQYCFSIEHNKKFIGQITLRNFVWKKGKCDTAEANIGFWVSPEFQNKGFMTEVLDEIVPFGFRNLNLCRITAETFSENTVSQNFLKKCGARKIGTIKQAIFKSGKLHDDYLYEFVNENWKPNE